MSKRKIRTSPLVPKEATLKLVWQRPPANYNPLVIIDDDDKSVVRFAKTL